MNRIRLTLGLITFAVLAVGVLAAAMVLEIPGIASSDDSVKLEGVPEDTLRSAGISLKRPGESFAAVVSAEAAATAAVSAEDDVKVKDVVLARVIDQSKVPPTDEIMWVVQLDTTGLTVPAYGPPGSPPEGKAIYWLIFVDPDTGKPLYSSSAATTDEQ